MKKTITLIILIILSLFLINCEYEDEKAPDVCCKFVDTRFNPGVVEYEIVDVYSCKDNTPDYIAYPVQDTFCE